MRIRSALRLRLIHPHPVHLSTTCSSSLQAPAAASLQSPAPSVLCTHHPAHHSPALSSFCSYCPLTANSLPRLICCCPPVPPVLTAHCCTYAAQGTTVPFYRLRFPPISSHIESFARGHRASSPVGLSSFSRLRTRSKCEPFPAIVFGVRHETLASH